MTPHKKVRIENLCASERAGMAMLLRADTMRRHDRRTTIKRALKRLIGERKQKKSPARFGGAARNQLRQKSTYSIVHMNETNEHAYSFLVPNENYRSAFGCVAQTSSHHRHPISQTTVLAVEIPLDLGFHLSMKHADTTRCRLNR